jgi:hypothetical protein
MKKIIKIILGIFVSVGVIACAVLIAMQFLPNKQKYVLDISNFETKQPDSFNSDAVTILQGMGIRVSDLEGKNLPFNQKIRALGDQLDCYVTLINAVEDKNIFRLRIFVDDTDVDFCVDKSEKEHDYLIEMPANTLINIPITVFLKEIDRKVEHKLWFFVEQHSDVIPDTEHAMFFYNIDINFNFNFPESNQELYLSSAKAPMVAVNDDIKENANLSISFSNGEADKYKRKREFIATDGEIDLRINAFNDIAMRYYLFAIVDNQLVKLSNNSLGIVWESNSEEMTDIPLTLTDLSIGEHSFFVIAMPIDSNMYTDTIVSEKILIKF